jgi:hypothetical protein
MATAKTIYREELITLSDDDVLHFNARKATAATLQEFNIQKLALKTQSKALHLWEMLNTLLDANPALSRKRERYYAAQKNNKEENADEGTSSDGQNKNNVSGREGDDVADTYWAELDVLEELGGILQSTGSSASHALKNSLVLGCMLQFRKESLRVVVSKSSKYKRQ